MANNLIQIRRSNTSSTPGTTLNGGELAYSYNGNTLFIGAQTGVGTAATKIAGAKFGYVDNSTAGTLTANAAVIVDANAFITNTYTAGLFVASSIASPAANATAALITSISPQYTAGQLGATVGGSNTELATTWAIKSYVDNKTAAAITNTAAQYAWTNNHTFSNNVSLIGNGSVLTIGNATIAVAISANGSNGISGQSLLSNGTSVYWGTPAGLFSNGTAYTFSAVETFTSNIVSTASVLVGNTTAANLVTNSTIVAVYANTATAANTILSSQLTTAGIVTNAYSVNATANGTSVASVVNTSTFTLTSNVLSGNASIAGNSFFANTSAITLGNTSVNSSLTTASLNVPSITATANATLGSQVVVSNTVVNFGSVANLYAASANLSINNMVISGNLTVQGTVSTIDSTNTQLKDNVILLADGNSTGDTVDFGVVGQANSGLAGTATYYGFARIASANAFQFFATNTAPGSMTIASQTVMPLQAYLQPYGSDGAFVVNSSAVTATANSTLAVNITANTITIASGLAATSGGTGRTTGFTAGDILFASNATYMSNLAIGTYGQVLQVSSSNLPSWGTLDGGTF